MGKGRGKIQQVNSNNTHTLQRAEIMSSVDHMGHKMDKSNKDLEEYENHKSKSISSSTKLIEDSGIKAHIDSNKLINVNGFSDMSAEANAEYIKQFKHYSEKYGNDRRALDKIYDDLDSKSKLAPHEREILNRIDNLATSKMQQEADILRSTAVVRPIDPSTNKDYTKAYSVASDTLSTLNNTLVSAGHESLKNFAMDDIDSGHTLNNVAGFYSKQKSTLVISGVLKNDLFDNMMEGYFDGFNASFTVKGTVAHEYGHHVDSALSKNAKTKSKIEAFKKKHANSEKVTDYAHASHDEAFAEAFTIYTTGEAISRGKSYYTDFEKLMSDVGLSSFKNILTTGRKRPQSTTTPKATQEVKATKTTTETPKPTSTKTSITSKETTKATTTKATPPKTSTPKVTEKPTSKPATPKATEKAKNTVTTKEPTTKTTSKPETPKTTVSTKPTTKTATKGTSTTKYNVGDTHKFVRGGIQTVTFSSTDKERGYATKEIGGIKYYIDLNGRVTTTVPKPSASTGVSASVSKPTVKPTPSATSKVTTISKPTVKDEVQKSSKTVTTPKTTTSTKVTTPKVTTPTTSSTKYNTGDTHTFTRQGTKYSVTFTATDTKRGYKLKTINGRKYKIDLNGRVTLA